MQRICWTDSASDAATERSDQAVALVHFLLKEVDWIEKLSRRLCRGSRGRRREDRDLECIRELSGSVAEAMRSFLDEARGQGPCGSVVEIGTLLEEAADQVLRRFPRTQVRIAIDADVRRASVSSELLVPLVAVLENAVDFSPATEPVRVCACSDEGLLAISIEDSGSGMQQHVASVCQTRGFTTRPGEGGHGFGLYAASRILARIGGGITIASRPGVGTRVRLTVPLPCVRGLDADAEIRSRPPSGAALPTAPEPPSTGPAPHRPPRGSRC